VQASLALVGEVEIAVGGEVQVVDPDQAFRVAVSDDGLETAGPRVERQHSAFVIGDERPSVGMELQAVRPAVILAHHVPVAAVGGQAKDPTVGDIDQPEVAVGIDAWALEETVGGKPRPIGRRPPGAGHLAQAVGQAGEDVGLDVGGRGK